MTDKGIFLRKPFFLQLHVVIEICQKIVLGFYIKHY